MKKNIILFFIEYRAYPNREYIHDFPFFDESLYVSFDDAVSALSLIKEEAIMKGYNVEHDLDTVREITIYETEKISVDCYIAQRSIFLSDIQKLS